MLYSLNAPLTIADKGTYLHISGSRFLNNYPSTLNFTKDICATIENRMKELVLVDCSNFASIITPVEVFNLIRLYELKFAFCQKLRLAVIVSNDEIEMARYWEDLCGKRGFNFKVFLTFEEGEKWLLLHKIN